MNTAKILPFRPRIPYGPSRGPATIIEFDDYLPIWTLMLLVCGQCLTQWTAASISTAPEIIKQITCPLCQARGWTSMLYESLKGQSLVYLKWLEGMAKDDPDILNESCPDCGEPLTPEPA